MAAGDMGTVFQLSRHPIRPIDALARIIEVMVRLIEDQEATVDKGKLDFKSVL